MFIYLAIPGLSCGMQDLWALAPRPGIKPGSPCIESLES